MQIGQCPVGCDLEDGAAVGIGSAELSRAVEHAVAPLQQASLRIIAIGSIESMERRNYTFRRYLKNSAIAEHRCSIVIRATFARRAIKTAIAGLHQAGCRATAVPSVKRKQGIE